MKANELRIGNYVNSNPFNGIITVFHNDKCVVKHKSGIVKCLIDDLQPIQLTEEWLLKCGFYLVDKNFFIHDSLSLGIRKSNGFYMNHVTKEIKYLHQLQNLYFALTGEELKIEL